MNPTETTKARASTATTDDRVDQMRRELAELRELVQQVLARADRAQEKITTIRAGKGKKGQQTESVMVRFTPAEMKRVEASAKRLGLKNAALARRATIVMLAHPELLDETEE